MSWSESIRIKPLWVMGWVESKPFETRLNRVNKWVVPMSACDCLIFSIWIILKCLLTISDVSQGPLIQLALGRLFRWRWPCSLQACYASQLFDQDAVTPRHLFVMEGGTSSEGFVSVRWIDFGLFASSRKQSAVFFFANLFYTKFGNMRGRRGRSYQPPPDRPDMT